jgi:glutaredoxin-like YruB-family protein
MMTMKVKIYTSPYCHFCHLTKEYLDKKGVKYEDINVLENRKGAKEMVELSGQDAVPLILIDDKMIIGFDQKRIDEALKL